MELKEMEGIYVMIHTIEDFDEFKEICTAGGWTFIVLKQYLVEENYDFCLTCTSSPRWAKSSTKKQHELITLAEFKKEQGIMKYKKDDVLRNKSYTLTVQGSVGNIYFCIDCDDDARMYTEKELDQYDYELKTDTPTKTDMTVAEIAKKLGMKPEELNVVADK